MKHVNFFSATEHLTAWLLDRPETVAPGEVLNPADTLSE